MQTEWHGGGEKPYEVICCIVDYSHIYMVKDENEDEKTLHKNKLLFLATKIGDECNGDESVQVFSGARLATAITGTAPSGQASVNDAGNDKPQGINYLSVAL